MPEQIAGRFGWFVSWVGQLRVNPWRTEPDSSNAERRLDAIDFDAAERDSFLIERLTANHLKAAVEQLPSHERHVLLLHVNGGMTYWEIAGHLGVAEQVVLSDLSHAYSQLRIELSVDESRGPRQ